MVRRWRTASERWWGCGAVSSHPKRRIIAVGLAVASIAVPSAPHIHAHQAAEIPVWGVVVHSQAVLARAGAVSLNAAPSDRARRSRRPISGSCQTSIHGGSDSSRAENAFGTYSGRAEPGGTLAWHTFAVPFRVVDGGRNPPKSGADVQTRRCGPPERGVGGLGFVGRCRADAGEGWRVEACPDRRASTAPI